MGKRALEAFAEAERLGGVVAKMRLASKTSVTSAEAAAVDDAPELIARMKRGLDEIRKQFGQREEETLEAPVSSGARVAEDLRRHVRAHLELMTRRDLLFGTAQEMVRRVDETAAETLRVNRVSVWLLEAEPERIRCLDLYELDARRHSEGLELMGSDFPAYFKALSTERTLAAHDAIRDPRTSCFADSYLRPLGIGAMLDVPIWVDGQVRGVVCHEHVGGQRTWNADEETFAYLMSSFVGLALESQARRTGAAP